MIHQQILSGREKILVLIAATLLIVLVVVGYTRTVGTNFQAASIALDLNVAGSGH